MKQEEENKNGFGVASLVLGICSIIIPFIGAILGILAIIFYKKQKDISPNSMATAGLVMGIISTVMWGIWWIIVTALMSVGLSAL